MSAKSKTDSALISVVVRFAVIIAVTVAVLSAVNYLTKDRIAENKSASTEKARQEMFPDADTFASVKVPDAYSSEITGAFRVSVAGSEVGYCFTAEEPGFSDTIYMIIGVSSSGTVVGIEVISDSETVGIGKNITEGDAMTSALLNSSVSSVSSVDTVSGATYTSAAMKNGVIAALKCADYFLGKEVTK